MSLWEVKDRGLLPSTDPLTSIVAKDEKYVPLVAHLENIVGVLPHWIVDRKVREELVFSLRDVSYLIDTNFLLNQSEAILERLLHIFSFMANAYVYAEKENMANRIPSEIAIPLNVLAEKLSRKPILSNISYFVYNWQKIDAEEPIEYNNIRSLSNFSFQQEECEIIKLMVALEASGQEGVKACCEILEGNFGRKNHEIKVAYNDILTKLFVSLAKMNAAVKKFNEFFDLFKTDSKESEVSGIYSRYLSSFNNIVFEGCFDNKPINISSDFSLFPNSLTAILMVLEMDSILDSQNKVKDQNLPVSHRNFFESLHQKIAKNDAESLGLRVISQAESSLHEIYNECIGEIYQLYQKNSFFFSDAVSSHKDILKQHML